MANAKNTTTKTTKRSTKKTAKRNLAPNKLVMLVTVVNRQKAEYYLDLLQDFNANLQLDISAFGTAPKLLGLLEGDIEKQVIFSVIRQDVAKKALETLEEKFKTIRNGKGIAFTVPLSSTIGVAIYQFLSNAM
ncbi:MAG: hypothetical protein IJV78_04125 [Clostridia bacterium]|nr:hypothetical protein [Clostridia bacterium]MBQ9707060.1 hypothetical protein [Clostridia bacterium]MBR7177842.1 hypothetical protein [Clostridia bacterium]